MNEEIVFGEKEPAGDVAISPEEKKAERKVVGACPVCGSDVYEYSWGWGCSKGKECEFTLKNVILGHTVTDEEISDLLIKGKTGLITDFVSKKDGEIFCAHLTYKEKLRFIPPNDESQQ